jgi:hypothetical protein
MTGLTREEQLFNRKEVLKELVYFLKQGPAQPTMSTQHAKKKRLNNQMKEGALIFQRTGNPFSLEGLINWVTLTRRLNLGLDLFPSIAEIVLPIWFPGLLLVKGLITYRRLVGLLLHIDYWWEIKTRKPLTGRQLTQTILTTAENTTSTLNAIA